jgi:endonuclease-3
MTALVDRNHGRKLVRRLRKAHPGATCTLSHQGPLQLLVATILSAQCTDARVNLVTPALFAKYRDAEAFAGADPAELEAEIRSTGFFRTKARAIREACRDIVERHGGQVPATLEELTALRGVGRKTANVVLGNAFSTPGITVDTHVRRVSRRLGLTDQQDPVKIERDLMRIVSRADWTDFSHMTIRHGRTVCAARKPLCGECVLRDLCPSSAGVSHP